MSAMSRTKGRKWQTAVRQWLELAGLTVVESGGAGIESGDLLILSPLVAVEAKNQQRMDLAGWVDQATRQAPKGAIPVVVHHRAGRASVADGYVTMSGAAFLDLIGDVT